MLTEGKNSEYMIDQGCKTVGFKEDLNESIKCLIVLLGKQGSKMDAIHSGHMQRKDWGKGAK